jgi:hypothetical protein
MDLVTMILENNHGTSIGTGMGQWLDAQPKERRFIF